MKGLILMGFSPFGGFGGAMFSIIPIIIALGFVFVFGIIIVTAIKGVGQWKTNNASPVLSVDAKIVTKRTNVHHHNHHTEVDNISHMSSSTTYYLTFEVNSGDRMEFSVSDQEYGLLAENDTGVLTFQGTRYLGFQRNKS
ncbi:MAG: DUF2500 domain-containing protein [Oscillospiraceae bacterium]